MGRRGRDDRRPAADRAAMPRVSGACAFLRLAARRHGPVRRRRAALRPALIWLDRRATAEAALIGNRVSAEDFYDASGVNLDSSHGAFKALWVRAEEGATFGAARHLLTPGSFVLRHATGEIAVDYSNASSLGLLDPRELTWSRGSSTSSNSTRSSCPRSSGNRRRRARHAPVRRGLRPRSRYACRLRLRRRDGRDARRGRAFRRRTL